MGEFLKEIELSTPQEQTSLIKGEIYIQKEDVIFRCEALIEFEPQLECSRCVTVFRKKVEAKGSCFFTNKPFADSSKQHSISGEYNDEICLTQEDMDAYVYQGNTLQLDEFILDVLQTSIPQIPVCSSDCRGLCVQCGVNLNEVNYCEQAECETEFVVTH